MRAPASWFARAVASSLALALPVAGAEAPPRSEGAGRVRFALRSGFGVPFGHYAEVRTLASFRDDAVNAIGDDTHGVIPLWVDVGYWLSSRLLIGGYFVYGLVLPKVAPASNPLAGGCPENFDCAATGLRAGIQAEYSIPTGSLVHPWLGIGLGYEWVHTRIESQQIDFQLESGNSGPEFLHLQGGADFALDPRFALGPFATLSGMQYTSCSLKLAGQDQPCEIDDKAWHGWLLFGVRGTLDL